MSFTSLTNTKIQKSHAARRLETIYATLKKHPTYLMLTSCENIASAQLARTQQSSSSLVRGYKCASSVIPVLQSADSMR